MSEKCQHFPESPIETILSQPHLSMARYNENNVDKQISTNPFHFSPNQIVRAHVATLQNLPVEITRPYGTDASLLSEADQQAFVEHKILLRLLLLSLVTYLQEQK